MAATREDIHRWFKDGKKRGATHMIVACDEFDWEDFPVYVMSGDDVQKRVREYQEASMSRVMEVYSYKKSWEEQESGRVWNIE